MSAEPVDATMGAMYIGVLISAVLHGLTLIQAYNYFTSYPKDALRLKILVTVLVVSDAAHLALIGDVVYYDLITTYYNHEALLHAPFSLPLQTFFATVNANIVQWYFALRAWNFGKSNLLLLFMFILSLGQNACAVAWASLLIQFQPYPEALKLSTPWRALTLANSSLSAAIDIIIATRLIALLRRSRTGLDRSDKLINKITLFIVSTGSLTSLCAALSIVFIVAFPQTLIGAAFYICLGRLYTNSFIATLNARSHVIRTEDGATNQFTSVPHDIMTTY
ncbi:hypothetical protein AX14_012389 [Amanita brunnescens Koide BX004]|nr:hypothetical protein AX14_012389 [Amanita brunnescens Koide BX004]